MAVFQFGFSLIIAIPSALVSDPPVALPDLPQNMVNGMKCYVGINSVTCGEDDDCTEDDCNPAAPLFVNIYLVFNQFYNLLIIMILKYGSANLLYLALTLMVPLGNVAFTLPFVPQHQPLRVTDIIGLIVICLGLGCYRFAAKIAEHYFNKDKPRNSQEGSGLLENDKKDALFSNLLATDTEEGNPLH